MILSGTCQIPRRTCWCGLRPNAISRHEDIPPESRRGSVPSCIFPARRVLHAHPIINTTCWCTRLARRMLHVHPKRKYDVLARVGLTIDRCRCRWSASSFYRSAFHSRNKRKREKNARWTKTRHRNSSHLWLYLFFIHILVQHQYLAPSIFFRASRFLGAKI